MCELPFYAPTAFTSPPSPSFLTNAAPINIYYNISIVILIFKYGQQLQFQYS